MDGVGRVAIVHERFTELGGSEKVVEALAEVWPDATIHAPIVDDAALPAGLRQRDIRTSALQRLYRGGGNYGHLLPLLPRAMASMDLGRPELVILSHHAFAHRASMPAEAVVVSYTHTPSRWMWDRSQRRMEGGSRQLLLDAMAALERRPDRRAAQRPDRIVANSETVVERIARWWGRGSVVVYPPVDTDFYTPDPAVARQDFLLLPGRLVPYKRPEVAVAAATRNGWPLVVAGEGRMRPALEAVAGPTVRFVGRVEDHELRDLYRRCAAALMPGVEDFGIVPVEAQACGAPVVALAEGGATSTVVDGRTGILYQSPVGSDPVAALSEGVERLRAGRFDTEVLRAHAEGFSRESFKQRFAAEVEVVVATGRPG